MLLKYSCISADSLPVMIHANDQPPPLIPPASGQIVISRSGGKVARTNHQAIYILMSMTLDGSVEWAVLIDAKQRQAGKF